MVAEVRISLRPSRYYWVKKEIKIKVGDTWEWFSSGDFQGRKGELAYEILRNLSFRMESLLDFVALVDDDIAMCLITLGEMRGSLPEKLFDECMKLIRENRHGELLGKLRPMLLAQKIKGSQRGSV